MNKRQKKTGLTFQVTPGFVEQRIYIIRGIKVMLDSDLAELYQVLTKNLNKAVKRNKERFPDDFMFQLTKEETKSLRFQIGTTKNETRGGKAYLPHVFTELGVAMLSSVLSSNRAVQVNIYIMRAFVKLREIMATNEKVAQKIKELEKGQKENTEAIIEVASTLARLMDESVHQKDAIGFTTDA